MNYRAQIVFSVAVLLICFAIMAFAWSGPLDLPFDQSWIGFTALALCIAAAIWLYHAARKHSQTKRRYLNYTRMTRNPHKRIKWWKM